MLTLPTLHRRQARNYNTNVSGGVNRPSRLWGLLLNPQNVQSEVPKDRFNIDSFYHEDGSHPGRSNARHGYFIKTDVRAFDAPFFGIQASETESLDPQQRLILETTYEALCSAGIPMQSLRGSPTAVYLGIMTHDYELTRASDTNHTPAYGVTGGAASIASNRVSYFFDCSSLVAAHQAVQQLCGGESKVAIAAVTNLTLSPLGYITESKLKMLSPTGRSRIWDALADGYARGEGVAALVLKTLSQAIQDDDSIECVIRETGVNQDGRTPGTTMPSARAQQALIRQTYEKGRARFWARPLPEKLIVGSIKTVIGHTEGAAGIAGLLKASMAVQHGVIPPNMLFETLSPRVAPFYDNLRIVTEATPWSTIPFNQPRRASVNSCGFGGTNAHAIIEQYLPGQHDKDQTQQNGTSASSPSFSALPLVLSASSERSLRTNMERLLQFLQDAPFNFSMTDLAWTLLRKQSALAVRQAIRGSSREAACFELQRQTAPLKNVPTEHLADALLRAASVVVAQGMLSDLPPKTALLMLDPPRFCLDEIARQAEARGVRALLVTSSSVTDEDTSANPKSSPVQRISLNPHATEQELVRILPGNVGALHDFSAGSGKVSSTLGRRLLQCLPQAANKYSAEYMVNDEASSIFIDADEKQDPISSLLEGIRCAAENWKDAKTEDQVAVAVKDIGTLPESSVGASTILDWTADSEVPAQVRAIDSDKLFANDKTALWDQEVEAAGGKATTLAMDVTSESSIETGWAVISRTLPPIGGIAFGLLVLSDALLKDMPYHKMNAVLNPRIYASRLLHDPLMQKRQTSGLAGPTINIGAVFGVGFIHRSGREADFSLRQYQTDTLSEQELHTLFAEAVVAGRRFETPAEGRLDVVGAAALEVTTGVVELDSTRQDMIRIWSDPRTAALKKPQRRSQKSGGSMRELLFANTLPLRVAGYSPGLLFGDVAAVKGSVTKAMLHSRLAYPGLLELLGVGARVGDEEEEEEKHGRDRADVMPLFQAFFDYRQGSTQTGTIGEARIVETLVSREAMPYDVMLEIFDDPNKNPLLTLKLQASLYEASDAEVLLNAYVSVVSKFALNPAMRLSDINAELN
ncbi:hypothetical protein PspLS_03350 [Pyricularia sp. CBS 133598]|nr:hypothetical protein PspLS_03350 [Pyricularia sp. CBS 133598]